MHAHTHAHTMEGLDTHTQRLIHTEGRTTRHILIFLIYSLHHFSVLLFFLHIVQFFLRNGC
uniref:Uncharacterized protein n=1 Tax=Anguilla anguilla TaxID=7936 RepID=A0A0E9X647_ANGAN